MNIFTSNSETGAGGGGTADGFGGAIFNLDGKVLLSSVTYSGDTDTKSNGFADSGPFAYNLSHNASNVASGQTATATFNLISTPLAEAIDVVNNKVNGTAAVNVNPSIAAAVVSPGALGFSSISVDEPVPSQTVTLSNVGNSFACSRKFADSQQRHLHLVGGGELPLASYGLAPAKVRTTFITPASRRS